MTEWIDAEDDDLEVVLVDPDPVGAVEPERDREPTEVDDLRALLAEAKTPARRKMLADRIRRLGG